MSATMISRKERHLKYLLRGISLIGVLAAWELIGMYTHPILFPRLSSVIKAWVRLAASGEIPKALETTLATLFLGFGAALIVSLLVGMPMGRYRKVEKYLMPYITIGLVVPTITLIPLLTMWFGIGMAARVAMVFLFCVDIMTVNVAAGVKGTDVSLVEMARSFGAGERSLFYKIRLPSSLPLVLAGIRLGLGRAVVGVITAEMLVTVVGLGDLVMYYGAKFDTPALFAAILTIIVIGLVLLQVVDYVYCRIVFWK